MPRLILLGYGLAAAQAYQRADVACIDASPALVVATTLCVARVCSQVCKYVLRLLGYGLATAMAFRARYVLLYGQPSSGTAPEAALHC